MILHFIAQNLLLLFAHLVVANWKLIDISFTELIYLEIDWLPVYSSGDVVINGSCQSNQLYYVELSSLQNQLKKLFTYRCYQVQIILDIFFIEATTQQDSQLNISYIDHSGSTTTLYYRAYKDSDLINNQIICNSSISHFEFKTIKSTIIDSTNKLFDINILFQQTQSNVKIGIRNLLIYANACHSTCLTCNGILETDCLTCYDSQVLQNGKCTCISDQQFSSTTVGCLQECKRNYSIARNDKVCVEDKRIESYIILFNETLIPPSNYFRYMPLIYQPDIFHKKNNDLIFDDCNQHSFVGKLQFSEGMLYKMTLKDSVKFLRIRITFYLSQFQQSSKIEILHNNQIQSIIMKDSVGFKFQNLTQIFEKQISCSNDDATLLRIEMIFQISDQNPNILFQGQLQQESEFWGLKNITVDIGVCQQYCRQCSNFHQCSICETTYTLYRASCVNFCPIHSSNCVDYEDIIPNSRYLAKGFYNMNMTFDEIASFYDQANLSPINYVTNEKFSFLNNKIVLGGLYVWFNGSYTKTWKISKPHHAVSIYFNLTYGDGFSGSFYYNISNKIGGPFEKLPNSQINLIGSQEMESIQFFYVHLDNFNSNELYIEFECKQAITNVQNTFCAISDYFIVVHYCLPFCENCQNINTCLIWEGGLISNQNCQSNQYISFEQKSETYSCKNCDRPGCNQCTSEENCTSCSGDQFQLQNGICLCKPFTFLSANTCVQCNRYCENCFGDQKFNCLSCIQEFHRSIQKNECLCQPGYYDDGINLPCIPICGDQIVVDEEDCDDGNNNPFDGCDQCKFACQEECLNCLQGQCYECKSNYFQIQSINKCQSICGDQAIVKNEQCDDGNNNPYDGCHLCQISCLNHCIDCKDGICFKCDEVNGWYLKGVQCELLCENRIISKIQENCDYSNSDPYNSCSQCETECSKNCILCKNGDCLECQIGFTYQKQNKKCIEICGDNFIVQNEQCDGQITQNINTCQNCQFRCHPYCEVCIYGDCLSCQVGYLLINNNCEQVCGDGQIVGTEICDTLVQDINSNCFNCNFNCGIGCLFCSQAICEMCKIGYLLVNYQCISICGDSIIVESEQCDDGNQIPYDGCHDCNYSCEIECNFCLAGVCADNNQVTLICPQDCNLCSNQYDCLVCNEHYHLIDDQCAPICGDGFIIDGLEECDDGNDIPYDGCYQCQFQCQYGCAECSQDKCYKCYNNFYFLDSQSTQCLQLNFDGSDQIDSPNSTEQYYTNIRCGENQLIEDYVCVNQCGN